MQTAGRVHNSAELARPQGKGGLLELLLHVASAEVAQVTSLTGAAAVRLALGQLAQRDVALLDTFLVALDDGSRLVLGTRDLGLR